MKFHYDAYTKSGDHKSGTIEAAEQKEAEDSLRKRGLLVTSISAQSDKKSTTTAKHAHSNAAAQTKSRIPVKVVADFARELSVLVATGTPIIDAIEAIESQCPQENFKTVLARLRTRLEEGDSLADAMTAQVKVFGHVFCALVAAGETSGNLDAMLNRVAKLLRQEAKIRANIAGAMLYPALLSFVSIVVLGLMLGVVLPRFAGLFESLDSPLPATTKFLMALSNLMLGYWWALIPAFAVAVGGAVMWVRSPKGTATVERASLKLPVLGPTVRSIQTARIFRVLGLLLESKVPILESIELTQRSVSNTLYKTMLERAEDAVTIGEPVSNALASGSLIVPSAIEAVRNGERSGRMGPVMVQLADHLDEENETVIKSISSIVEPVIMIALGLMVGFVAISMFLPLFDLTASAGGH